MFPTICTIGPVSIHFYGLMLALAAIICSWLMARDAKKNGLSVGMVVDLVFWCVVGGIIGCRIFYVVLNFSYFAEYPLEIIMIHKGGLAWQGGLIFGTIFGIIFIKKHKLPLFKMLDFTAPYIALGQSIGRIGCFLNGCCYGKPFKYGIYSSEFGTALHPTQLYDAVGLFIIFWILKKHQERKGEPGYTFVLYLLFAAALRFIVQFFRYDYEPVLWGMSVFQFICLVFIMIAGFIYASLKSQRRR